MRELFRVTQSINSTNYWNNGNEMSDIIQKFDVYFFEREGGNVVENNMYATIFT